MQSRREARSSVAQRSLGAKNASDPVGQSVWRGVRWLTLVVGFSVPALLQAHHLDTRATSISFDRDFLATLSSRSPASLKDPRIRVNAEFGAIIKTTPGPGTATGSPLCQPCVS